MQNEPHSPFMMVAGFHPITGAYTGQVAAYLSPLEGTYPMPAYAIAAQPDLSALAGHQAYRVTADGTSWAIVPDYSSATVYDTATAGVVDPPAFGQPLPVDHTVQPPPTLAEKQAAQWNRDEQAWRVVADLRGTRYWLPDGSEHKITETGVELPVDALDAAPLPTIQALRAKAVATLPAWEQTERAAGIDHNGHRWLTTPTALQDIRDVLLAGAVPGEQWVTADRQVVPMTMPELQVQWQAITARGAAIYRRRLEMEAEIEAMDAEQLAAFVPGWPA